MLFIWAWWQRLDTPAFQNECFMIQTTGWSPHVLCVCTRTWPHTSPVYQNFSTQHPTKGHMRQTLLINLESLFCFHPIKARSKGASLGAHPAPGVRRRSSRPFPASSQHWPESGQRGRERGRWRKIWAPCDQTVGSFLASLRNRKPSSLFFHYCD